MTPRRWTDEMLDRQAETMEQLLEGQRMLVQIYQQEHEARVEADRRFNRFIEEQQRINREQQQINREQQQINQEQQQINQEQQRINQRLDVAIARLDATIERLERIITFRSDNGNLG